MNAMTPVVRSSARYAVRIATGLAVSVLIPLASTPGGLAQAPAGWQDPAKHQLRLVPVDQGVSLEVLDWGGSGPSVILLAGSGNTAHVFDDFAPKLLDCCHVYGITRRGYGASTRPPGGYDDQRLADDVYQVIERERIPTPVLIGHSMAGGEMTTVGRQHSDRLSGLVYLDALGDLEDDPPADKEWAALQQKLPPSLQAPRACAPLDRRSFAAYRQSMACRMGFMFPQAELRYGFESVGGAVGEPKTPGWVSRAIGQAQVFRRDYSNIRVPVLVLMNRTRTTEQVLAETGYTPKNDAERVAIDQFMARSAIVFDRFTAKLTRQVPDARIVDLPNAGHYVFLTRETEVLREIHAFVAKLPHNRPAPRLPVRR